MPISSGPMMVQSFTSDEQATLVPNKNYWGAKVATVPGIADLEIVDGRARVVGTDKAIDFAGIAI